MKLKTLIVNDIYEPLLFDKSRYLIIYGGAGAGKSYFCAQKVIFRSLAENYSRFLILRRYGTTLRYSVFYQVKQIINELDLQEFFDIREFDMRITCKNGNEIIFSGLDDPEKLKSITGITSVWIEEASEITYEDFIQVDLRLRSNEAAYMQIMLTFNPITGSWLKDFIEKNQNDERMRIVNVNYLNNKFISKEYAEVLEGLKEKNEALYSIYTLGAWAAPEDLVFPKFEIVKDYKMDGEIIAGLDFGFVNPSAFVIAKVNQDTVYVMDEVYASFLTIDELGLIIRSKMEKLKPIAVYADPSRADLIFELSGFLDVPILKGDNNVLAGINLMRRLKLVINEQCVNLIKELQSYRFQRKKDQVLEIPVKFNDHCIDALRYAVYTFWKHNLGEIISL